MFYDKSKTRVVKVVTFLATTDERSRQRVTFALFWRGFGGHACYSKGFLYKCYMEATVFGDASFGLNGDCDGLGADSRKCPTALNVERSCKGKLERKL